MTVQISGYTPPGAYIQEVVVPNALSISTVPQTLAIVGPGSTLRRANNEAVRRGGITGELLTVSAVSGSHTATLQHPSTALQNDSTLFVNGIPLNPSLWSFTSTTTILVSDNGYVSGATYTLDYVATDTDRDDLANDDARNSTALRVGAFAGVSTFTRDIDYQLDERARLNGPINDTFAIVGATNDNLHLQVDGRAQLAIAITAGAARTAAQIVTDINTALIASGTYGAAFGNVAEVYNGDQVRLTSPTQGPTSQIRINGDSAIAIATALTIFGLVVTASVSFIGNADVIDWSIDQAAELESSGAASPYNLTAVSVLDIAFDSLVDGAVQAEWTSLLAGPYDTSGAGNNTLRLNIDGRGNIDIVLTSGVAVAAATIVSEINAALLASGTYGATYATVASVVGVTRVRLTSPTTGASSSVEILNSGIGIAHTRIFELDNTQVPLLQRGDGTIATRLDVGAAITLAAIIVDINARFADHSRYGSVFSLVAQDNGTGRLRLLSPTQGATSKVRIQQSQTASAHLTLLGLTTAQLPFTITGTGTRPTVGSVYFVTYDFVRPATDYNTPFRVFNQDQLFGQVGDSSATNPLAIAGQIAFENDAPSIFVVQVRDADGDGVYSTADFQNAINNGLDNSAITEVCVVTPLPQTLSAGQLLDIQVTMLNHIVNKSSITAKKYRHGWFGLLRGTNIGDIDTANTFVYRARRTLQVAPDSPGRGRFILVAPPNVSKTLTLTDGTQPRINLDSTYVAIAVAARKTSFVNIATSLLRKLVTGFNTDDFQSYLDAEFNILASSGVTVVSNDAGRLVLSDPVTTEVGGGGVSSFSQINAMAQKDNCVRAVTQAVDANLVGIVPEDLTDFILDVKLVIAVTLQGLVGSGAIGPFRDDQGRTRDINTAADIQVFQSSTDPTRFDFRFYFNVRYHAARFFGEFAVDSASFVGVGDTAATA
jgi:hypothetical protein